MWSDSIVGARSTWTVTLGLVLQFSTQKEKTERDRAPSTKPNSRVPVFPFFLLLFAVNSQVNTVGGCKSPGLWTDLTDAVLCCEAALQLWYEQASGRAMRAPPEPLIRLGSAETPSQNSAVSAERRVRPWLQEVNKWTSCRGSRRLMTLYVTKCNKAELQGEQKLGKPLDLEDWRHYEKGVKAWA